MTSRKPDETAGAKGSGPEQKAAIQREDVDSEDLVARFARTFREVRRLEVEQIPTHISKGRFDLIVRLGHQLRGTAATFGLPEVGAAGERLERAASIEDAAGVREEMATLLRLLEER